MSLPYNSLFVPSRPKTPIILDPGMSVPIDLGGGIMNMAPVQQGSAVYNVPPPGSTGPQDSTGDNAPPSDSTGPVLQGQVIYTPDSPDPEDSPQPERTDDTEPTEGYPEENDDYPSEPAQPDTAGPKLLALLQSLTANSNLYNSPPNDDIVHLTYQPTNYSSNFKPTPVIYQQISVSNPQPIGQKR